MKTGSKHERESKQEQEQTWEDVHEIRKTKRKKTKRKNIKDYT